MKIFIIGTSGCGKTTLGEKIANKTGIPQYDLDDYYWLPNWVIRDSDEFQDILLGLTEKEQWIITGNYHRLSSHTWPKGDLVLWIDLPLPVLLWRVTKRALNNMFKKEPSCNGNQESISTLMGKEGIIWWVIKRYYKHKRAYKKHPLITRVTSEKEAFSIVNSKFFNSDPTIPHTGK